MTLDRAERITIKATEGNNFVLIAIQDGKQLHGTLEFDEGGIELARVLRDQFECPVRLRLGAKQDPRNIEFTI